MVLFLACWVGPDEVVDSPTDSVAEQEPPSLEGLAISPDPPQVGDQLSYSYDWLGPGEDLSTVEWFVEGSSVATPVALYDELVEVYVVPRNQEASGEPVRVTTRVANTPPPAPTLELVEPDRAQPLICTAVLGQDADGHDQSLTFSWTRDGEPFAEAVQDELRSTVAAEHLFGQHTWVCSATASDGLDEGEAASAELSFDGTCVEGQLRECPADSCRAAWDAGLPSGSAWLDTGDGPYPQACFEGWTAVFVSQAVSATADRRGAWHTNLQSFEPTGSMLSVWDLDLSVSEVRFACDGDQDGTWDYDVTGGPSVWLAIEGDGDGLEVGPVSLTGGTLSLNLPNNDEVGHADFIVTVGNGVNHPWVYWGTYDGHPYGVRDDWEVCNEISYRTRTGAVDETSTSDAWFYILVR